VFCVTHQLKKYAAQGDLKDETRVKSTKVSLGFYRMVSKLCCTAATNLAIDIAVLD
jgi:hypothetical protein